MSCDPDSGTAAGQQRLSAALTMKPLLIAKEEPDCADHVSDSKSNLYDDGHASSIKSSQHHQQMHHHHHQSNNNSNSNNNNDNNNADIGSDNEVNDHPLSHHLAASGIKLEAALLELNVGLNLISKPNNNNTMNDDNNNTNSNFNNNATTSNNDNNNNNTSNNNKDGNKAPRKLFECDVCNMKFSNGANMRRHKMRHTGVKPYECRVCQKRFFRKDHLAEHFTTHTKTLPYHCPICNRGFQRQIAMRAHFQNEHVGQHDLVKTCPLCSFRAGTMKSLRVHFFNRHGIDLDNPGSGTPSSLMLALEQSNSAHLLPALAAVAANAATGNVAAFSDSGESARSADNGTPPMHFLTPHVEISMAENNENNAMRLNSNNVNNSNSNSANNLINNNSNNNSDQNNPQSIQASSVAATTSSGLDIQAIVRPINHSGSPSSPHSADSNSNIPSSSHSSMLSSAAQNSRHMLFDSSITPSISLIPIKQEPNTNDGYSSDSNSKSNHRSLTSTPMLTEPNQTTPNSSGVSNSTESVTPTSSLASMIKVSPLKSLLREDLKRRITARANNRVARNMSATLTSSTTGGGGSSNSPNSVATPESPSAGTTSNGAITSTGADTEMMLMSSSSKKRNLQCLYCGIEFPDQTLYFLHKGCHSENNPWKCNICGDVCSNVYEFNSHLLSKSHQ